LPAAQSASLAQVAEPQEVAEPQATAPGQGVVVVGVTQFPAPSQAGAARRLELVQAGVPQTVVALANAHAPLPLHVPSWPQAAVSTAHLPCEPPPALIGRHSPLAAPVSVIAQELQVAVQALSQQKPPTQFPSAHWLLPVHTAPLASLGVHAPFKQ